jgi:hypothetical protein
MQVREKNRNVCVVTMKHRFKILETGFANVMFLHNNNVLPYDYRPLIMTAVINSLILQRQSNKDISIVLLCRGSTF